MQGSCLLTSAMGRRCPAKPTRAPVSPRASMKAARSDSGNRGDTDSIDFAAGTRRASAALDAVLMTSNAIVPFLKMQTVSEAR